MEEWRRVILNLIGKYKVDLVLLQRRTRRLVLATFISLSLFLALIARFAVRTLHFFEIVFTITVSIFLYVTSWGSIFFNYGLFSASAKLGAFCCFLIFGYITVPSVVLTAVSIGFWRGSLRWKLLIWLGSSAVLLGMEALAVWGKVIIYHDWTFSSTFAAWIVYLAVLFILVHMYRNLLRKDVRIP